MRTVVAEESAPIRTRAFPSVLEPPEITPLAFDVGGRLGPIDLRIGQDVSEGGVLATVEAVDADLRARQAEAQLSEAEAAARNARAEAARQTTLYERGIVAAAARDAAVTGAERAEARVRQAERTLDLEGATLADTTLRAPFDAVVKAIEVQAFGSVQAGEPVVLLYPDGELRATILVSYDVATSLSLRHAAGVRPGDGANGVLSAKVTEIARRAPAVSSFPVVVSLTETREDLRSGMAVEMRFDVPLPEAQEGIPIPISALALQRPVDLGTPPPTADVFVFREGADPGLGTVEPTTVRLGAVVEDRAHVVEGLAPGERVVSAGVTFLHPGMAVRIEAEASR